MKIRHKCIIVFKFMVIILKKKQEIKDLINEKNMLK